MITGILLNTTISTGPLLGSGVYYYRLSSGSYLETRKMIF